MTMLLSTALVAVIVILLDGKNTLVSAAEEMPTNCIDLSLYVESGTSSNNLPLLNGNGSDGDISNDVPVFFYIPEIEIQPNQPTNLCLSNLTIPTKVGDTLCNGPNKCWLAVGTKANSNDDDVTTSDYQCLCHGISMSDRYGLDVCGPSDLNLWGQSCTDVENGREGNASNVQVSICPTNFQTGCNICSTGGTQKAFKVGVQWISDPQCNPFNKSGAPFVDAVGISMNVVGLMTITIMLFQSMF